MPEVEGPETTPAVRAYWEKFWGGPAGFAATEERRYQLEPWIFSHAQFTRYHGQRLLEVGVGNGIDHLQWARAGAICHGVDLTEAAVEATGKLLEVHGLSSDLRRANGEELPFPDSSFDVVYSSGVIHHAERPERVVSEIHRVLRPGGTFIGMMYGRRSAVSLRLWVKYALFRGQPTRSLSDVLWHHMESPGTKAYTPHELRRMFAAFSEVSLDQVVTPHDRRRLPAAIGRIIPSSLGWFINITGIK